MIIFLYVKSNDNIMLSLSCQRISWYVCKPPCWAAWNSISNLSLERRPAGKCCLDNYLDNLEKAFHILIIGIDSLGVHPALMLCVWLYLQFSLQSVRRAATQSWRTPTAAPPSAPAGCSSHPCRTSSVITPSLRAGTSFRFLTSQPACPPSVWR